ncbi:hypothetical protein [Sciscionella sediminilitoris]|uniref:hypothetical protein n=1 Tax=Sciscionella sediminilitoris TaxID=1445613 RepID=UPI0004DED164|nr:hypothetical protein [Sciscionella sp. SE31]
MSAPEVNFSDLSNRPVDVAFQVENSASRSVRIRRRGHETKDLWLTTADRADQEHQVASMTTRLFVAMMQHDEQARALVVQVIPEAFPWVRFLATEDVRAFALELVQTLRAADSIANPAPVTQLVAEWQHTAEVNADPELRGILRSDGEDHGAVEPPAARIHEPQAQ